PGPRPARRPRVAAEQPDLAGVGLQQPEGHPQGGRLPGPVGPEQPVQLALVDAQVEAGEHHGSPEAPVDAFELDRRRRRPPLLAVVAHAIEHHRCAGSGETGRPGGSSLAPRWDPHPGGWCGRPPRGTTGACAPARQEAVLAALAGGVLGEADDPAVPGRMLELLGRLASRRDRSQLLWALGALDSRAGALLLSGRPAPPAGARPGPAGAVVRRWAASRLPPRRQLAAAIVPLALLAAY